MLGSPKWFCCSGFIFSLSSSWLWSKCFCTSDKDVYYISFFFSSTFYLCRVHFHASFFHGGHFFFFFWPLFVFFLLIGSLYLCADIMWTEATQASAEEDQTKLKWSGYSEKNKTYVPAAITVSRPMFVWCWNLAANQTSLTFPEIPLKLCALTAPLGNLWKQWWHSWMTSPCALDWLSGVQAEENVSGHFKMLHNWTGFKPQACQRKRGRRRAFTRAPCAFTGTSFCLTHSRRP